MLGLAGEDHVGQLDEAIPGLGGREGTNGIHRTLGVELCKLIRSLHTIRSQHLTVGGVHIARLLEPALDDRAQLGYGLCGIEDGGSSQTQGDVGHGRFTQRLRSAGEIQNVINYLIGETQVVTADKWFIIKTNISLTTSDGKTCDY